jgi:myxalamid-type polyketide synthase MxaE and MxaD
MTPTVEQIQDWIVTRVSALAELPPDEVDVNAPLARLGLDSVALVTLAFDLEKWLGYRFRSNPLNDHPTIAALSRFLAQQAAEAKPAG